jgi:hypothetical protein
MKKLLYLVIVILALGLIVSGCIPVVPTLGEKGNGNGNGNNGLKPPSGAHYNLNIIGKKSDWSGGGSYNNPDRHTMFVPEDTTGIVIPTPGDDGTTNVGDLPGIKIEMTQGTEFAVLDGNAFDDDKCAFQLAPGKYTVWITAKAKPPKAGEPDYYTNIGGWVFASDEFNDNYYFNIGSVTVKKKTGWIDATHIFYVSCTEDWFGLVACNGDGMWVFDYLSFLTAYDFGDDPDITDAAYFWQFDNHGNKLIKVRFYED